MIINTDHGCLAKFDLARHMLNLAGKCLVTGHYHKPCCVAQNFENFAVHKQSGQFIFANNFANQVCAGHMCLVC